jgi:enoyl-CoA hydratase/carnithine racemase
MPRDTFPDDPAPDDPAPDDLAPDDLALLAEGPISVGALRAGISAQPQAAAVAVDLLRSIDIANAEQGLVHESLAYGVLQGSSAHAEWLASRPRAVAFPAPGRVTARRDGNIVEIGLDRADARNAIDRTMRDQLFGAFSVAALDPDVTRGTLRGAGRTFSVGADLSEFGTTRDPATAHAIRMATLPAHAIHRCADKFEARVQGACVGSGLEMAAFAARLTATADAWFQLPELAMGLIPGAGGCVSVTRRIGRRRTVAMILSGRRINARTALAWGLIDEIVDDGTVNEREAHL